MINDEPIDCRLTLRHADFVMQNHRVHGVSVLPGVTFLDMIWRVLGARGLPVAEAELRNVVFAEAVATSDGTDREIRLQFGAEQGGFRQVLGHSRDLRDGQPSGDWRENMRAELWFAARPVPPRLDVAALKAAATGRREMADMYGHTSSRDIRHGAAMRCSGPLFRGAGYLLAELVQETPEAVPDTGFHLHPAKLDAATIAAYGQAENAPPEPFIPMFIERFRAPRALHGPFYVHVPRPEQLSESGELFHSDFLLYDADGEFVAECIQLTCKRIRNRDLIERLVWPATVQQPVEIPAVRAAAPAAPQDPAAGYAGWLRTRLADLLGRPAAQVDPSAGFYDLGLESVALLQLSEGLEELVGARLYPTLLFEYTHVDALARYLAETYGAPATGATEAVPPETAPTETAPTEAVPAQAVPAQTMPAQTMAGENPPAETLAFRPLWTAVPAERAEPAASVKVLLIAAEPGLEQALRTRLERSGGRLISVPSTDMCPEPVSREAWSQLLARAGWVGRNRAVVLAGALADAGADPASPAEAVTAATTFWAAAAAIVDRGDGHTYSVLRMHYGHGDAADPADEAIAALARTINAEHGRLRCAAMEVQDGTGDDELADALLAELADRAGEPQLRYHGGQRQLRRYQPIADLPAELPDTGSALCPGGVYLITGGGGGLGLLLAEHLLARTGGQIVLSGRSPAGTAVQRRIEEWTAAGRRACYLPVDVALAADVRRLVSTIRAQFGRIDGIVHCAGIVRDRLFPTKQPAEIDAVLAPKVAGIVHLDEATAADDLCLFAAFSSLAGSMANPGQCDYAYANGYLDAFMHARAARPDRSGRSVSIGWPLWAGGGMSLSDDALAQAARERGTYPLPAEAGLRMFDRALAGRDDRVVVLHGDPARISHLLPAGEPAANDAPSRHAAQPVIGSSGATPVPDRAGSVTGRSASAASQPVAQRMADQPRNVAIIGLAGQYPGAADLEQFWRNLAAGRDSVSEVPAERWNHDALFDPEKGRAGRTYSRWGGFLDGADLFDPGFFGISRREAEWMDPQERLFLMTCWRALEDAGYPPRELAGSSVGVFAGVMWNHYQLVTGGEGDVRPTAMHAAIANRVSYALNLVGPSMAVDTACSASLTAVHLAVASIVTGESDLALAGGVNVSAHEQKYLQLARGQFLATDGKCRSFGAEGSGYVPGEGVGAVLLKPLDRALADGDHVYAVIRASAVNHTGRTSGFTVPSARAQAAVIRDALQRSGLGDQPLDYIEAHGTGTSLGDPIELDGLRQAIDPQGRLPHGSVPIGSVKSNVGHLESAAGIAGITKVLLQFRHRQLVPSLHAEQLNPHIDFETSPFRVQRESRSWTVEPSGRPLLAGVSAFGAGGANAHLVLESAERPAGRPAPDGPQLFLLSARDDDVLRRYAENWLDFLAGLASDGDGRDDEAGLTAVIECLAEQLGVPAAEIGPADRLADLGMDATGVALLRASLSDRLPASMVLDPDLQVAEVARTCRADGSAVGPALADIAYTSQVGRQPMERRLALSVRSLAELQAGLRHYLAGQVVTAGQAWSGAEAAGPAPSGLAELRDSFAAGRLDEVAAAWVAGADVPWSAWRSADRGQRLPLPTYPFKLERCWLGEWPAGNRRPAQPAGPAEPAAERAVEPAAEHAVEPAAERAVALAAVPPRRVAPYHGNEVDFRVLGHGIALVRMQSPGGNMFTDGLMHGLQAAFATIEERADIRAVVLTGTEAAFSMGATADALQRLSRHDARFTDTPFVYEGLLRCTRPVVAAITGHASGGGLAFGLYADVVVLSDSALCSANFLQYGFTPGMGATYILEQRFGRTLAAEMMLTGRRYTGAELAQRGATVAVRPAAEVLSLALTMARSLADKPAAAVAALKAELAGRMLDRLPDIISSEVRMHERVLGSESAERVAAHFAKVREYSGEPAPAAELEAVLAPAPAVALEAVVAPDAVVAPAPAPAVQRAPEPAAPSASEAEPSAAIVPASPAEPAAASHPRLAAGEIEEQLFATLQAILYAERSELDSDVSFNEMGVDSIGAVEIVSALNRRFGLDLDSVAVYDHPTIPDLVAYAQDQLARGAALYDAAIAPSVDPMPEATPAPATEPAPPAVPAPAAAKPEPALFEPPASAPPSASVPQPVAAQPVPAPAVPARGVPALRVTVPAPVAEPGPAAQPAVADQPEPSRVRLTSLNRPASPRPAVAAEEPPPAQPAPAGAAAVRREAPAATPAPQPPATAVRSGDIAIIGASGRFPDAPDLESYWRNISTGRSSIAEVPESRWGPVADYYDPDRGATGRAYSKWAAMLPEIDAFDGRLFNLSPMESELMDPQQRIFLEEAWAALEYAGYASRDERRPFGVFVGCSAGDYAEVLRQAGRDDTGQAFLGGNLAILAGRIAYLLNFSGPTMVVDTACSSSLVAVHLACAAIRNGDCEAAVAGGVAVMVTPKMQVWTSRTGMLSPTGTCAPFDADADGIVLGEGAGVVVLKSLDRAMADGDHIHAVIRASGVNGDGRTNGITAPSSVSQRELLEQVCARAGIQSTDIGFVEAHGTGTELGDPIEAKALGQLFGAGGRCGLGSVKANIGHTTTAAGVAGLLKLVLALRHRQLPPQPNFRRSNDKIDLSNGSLFVVQELSPWQPGPSGTRIGMVSSFGFSGTNAIMLVAEPPAAPAPAPEAADGVRAVPVSARTEAALGELAGRLATALADPAAEPALVDVAFTLGAGRAHLPVRAVVFAGDTTELRAGLLELAADPARRNAPLGTVTDASLAARYLAGDAVDWASVHQGGRRVSLPGYPFARTRHWVVPSAGPDSAAEPASVATPGLLAEPDPGVEPVLRIAPADRLVAEHRVGDVPVLPGAAMVALALAAAADPAGRAAVRDVRWERLLRVTAPMPVRLVADADRGDGARRMLGGDLPVARVVLDAPPDDHPEPVDTARIAARCGSELAAADCYRIFERAGLGYGPLFRRLVRIRFGEAEALAELDSGDASEELLRTTAVLDAAIQAVLPLVGTATGEPAPLVPFAADRVRVYRPLAGVAYSHATRTADGGYDLRLLDAAGRVCASISRLALRPAPQQRPGTTAQPVEQSEPLVAASTAVYQPIWRERTPADGSSGPVPRTVAIWHPPAAAGLAEALAAGYRADAEAQGRTVEVGTVRYQGQCELSGLSQLPDEGYFLTDPDPVGAPESDPSTMAFLSLVTALLDSGARSRPLRLSAVVAGTVAAAPGDRVRPHAAGVVGLSSSLAAELPHWHVRCLDLPVDGSRPDDLARQLRRAPDAAGFTALRGERRLAREFVAVPAEVPGQSPWRAGGHYLIVGGAGGLGLALARHLARTAGARLSLVGRRPADADLTAAMAEIWKLGGEASYLMADVTDADQLRAAVAAAQQRFGPVHGVVHAAMVLRDRSLANTDESVLSEVLAPKVTGTAVLAEVVAGLQLDVLVLFSSVAALIESPGQGSYAAASTFQDSYGAFLAQRLPYPVVVLNWGYWGSVGAVADPDRRQRLATMGVGSIEPAEGLAALEAVLRRQLGQALVIKADPRVWTGLRLDHQPAAPATAGTGAAPLPGTGPAAEIPAPDVARARSAFAELDRVARELMRQRWQAVGAVPEIDVPPAQRRLLRAVRDIVRRAESEWTGEPLTGAQLLERFPELRPHLRLLDTCVQAVPDVLTGRASGTGTLFPRGATELVEAVYTGHPGIDYYHRLHAAALTEAIEGMAAESGRPVRILEIGAGTGATSRHLLPALAETGRPVRYDYTDISSALVNHGRSEFGSRYDFARFSELDIERDPAGQGYPAGSVDVVLATNVLHATTDMAQTLRRVHDLLRPGGLLQLDEVTKASDFLTLTFGLTEGWWRFSDEERRLPGAPLLGPVQWRAVLESAGLRVRDIRGFAGTPAEELEQCVIIAERPGPSSADVPEPSLPAVVDYVRTVFAEVLKSPADELAEDLTFENFGVDSLVGQTIVYRFERDLGELPSTLLFEHLTIGELARHLADRHAERLAAVLAPPAEPVLAEPTAAPLGNHSAQADQVGPRLVETDSIAADPIGLDVTVSDSIGSQRLATKPSDDRQLTGGEADDDIAVVGVAGRYPGGADLDELWRMLAEGRDAITEVPSERWDWRAYFDERRGQRNRSYARHGGFLSEVDRFDPSFFGILPREAADIDPQERLFLETCWDLLAGSGYLDDRWHERDTGVFVGLMYGSYGRMAAGGWPAEEYSGAHSAYWSVANRVSYFLDFQGPSFAVDSACSSSLTALHLACASLRRGECRMAIAGGVNLVLHPSHYIALSGLTMLSTDGACKTFDEGADGFVPGEGVGAVLLKPLRQAIADGDRIWAVVKASTVNAGGKTGGYTVPNPAAQSRLIAEAITRSGVDPASIGCVEVHGTGTALGDPIEVASLAGAFDDLGRGPARCAISSIKANIGHLEGAAGIAGLTKVLLQLRERQLAPCVNLGTPNPKIDFGAVLYPPRELLDWAAPVDAAGSPLPRRAGVSSFGAGGANAHVVLEEYPVPAEDAPEPVDAGQQLFLLSGRTAGQLAEYAGRIAEFLTDQPDEQMTLRRLAYTSQVGRGALAHRLVVLAGNLAELVDGLRAAATGSAHPALVTGIAQGATGTAADGPADPLALAQHWVNGGRCDWNSRWPAPRPRRVLLPGYPFARDRHWLAPAPLPQPAAASQPAVTEREVALTGLRGACVRDHLVAGQHWVPGALMLEIAAAEAATPGASLRLGDVQWLSPLLRDEGDPVSVTVRRDGELVTVELRRPGTERLAASCTVAPSPSPRPAPLDLAALRSRCPLAGDVAGLYQRLRAGGLYHGPTLQVLQELWIGDGEALGVLASADRAELRLLDPTMLDGALQVLAALEPGRSAEVPVGAASVTSYAEIPTRCLVHVRELAGRSGRRCFDLDIFDESGSLLVSIRDLSTAPVPEAERGDGAVRQLRPRWVAEPVPPAAGSPRTVVVLAAEPWLAGALAAPLNARGITAVQVWAGAEYERQGTDLRFAVRPGEQADYQRLVAELAGSGIVPEAVVVLAWPAADLPAATQVRSELDKLLLPTLWLTTSLLARDPAQRLRAVFGHLGPEASGGPAPLAGAVAAVLKTLSLEHSGFSGASIQLGRADGPASWADALLGELLAAADGVVEIGYRGAERLRRELARFEPPAVTELPLRLGGTYLVTGAGGRLARHLVDVLAQHGPVNLVLTGRREPDAETAGWLESLATDGVQALWVPAELSDRDAVRRLVATARDRFGGVRGVFHLAGSTRDGRAVGLQRDDLDAVLAAKVDAALQLDEALAGSELDFFVLFSSIAGETGNYGQVGYAYGNAFLNEFAREREGRRLAGTATGRTVAIGWPLWNLGGMTVSDTVRRTFQRRYDMVPLSTANGMSVLRCALAGQEPYLVAVQGAGAATPATARPAAERAIAAEPAAVAPTQPALAAAGERRAGERVEPAPASTAGSRPAMAEPARDQTSLLTMVEADLAAIAAGFLLVEPSDVDLRLDLLDSGFDSITLTELIGAVNDRYELDLLPTVLFECTNLAAFARHLVDQYGDRLPAAQPAMPEPAVALQASAPELSAPELSQPPLAATEELPRSQPAGQPAPATEPRTGGPDYGPMPIAVVGMAAVMPGSQDAEEFWGHLVAGHSLVGEVPADRTDLLADLDTRKLRAGFLADIADFDAAFFGIAPAEAALLDPQQRLFLQTAWRAVADAGYATGDLAGSRTGLFVGVSTSDYDDLLRAHGIEVQAHTATGLAHSILANRVSRLLDLRGPSEAVDTACSSALVAVHRAVRAIADGDCEAAIVGGVNAVLSPGLFLAFTKSGMLSPDGRCKVFDAAADGYVRGEGVGALLLKPLDRAEADGDHIYGVIRGTAVNHGGRSSSLTAPNPQAQADVIMQAHRNARLDPTTVSYLEAHGTGTRLGDPVEVEGLKQAFGQLYADHGRPMPAEPLIGLGSVKTNIGHLEAAAGMAGMIKVLLSMRHATLPPTLNYTEPNPFLRLAGTPFYVHDRLRPWPGVRLASGETVRRAGVSSFGFGGSNAHVVLEDYRGLDRPWAGGDGVGQRLFVLSAPNEPALRSYAGTLAAAVKDDPTLPLSRMAYTLQVGRDPQPERLAIVAEDRGQLIEMLAAAAAGRDCPGWWRGRAGSGVASIDLGTDDLATVAQAWVAGGEVDWRQLWPEHPRRLPLPSFPFSPRRHWFQATDKDESAGTPATAPSSPEATPASTVAAPQAAADHVHAGTAPTRPAGTGPAGTRPAGPAAPAPRPPVGRPGRPMIRLTEPTAQPAAGQPGTIGAPPAEARRAPEVSPAAIPPSAPTAASSLSAPSAPTAPNPETTAEVGELIRTALVDILGLPPELLDGEASFTGLGLDSIFRMQLTRQINERYQLELQASELYDFDTVNQLSAVVAEAIHNAPSAAAIHNAPPAAAPTSALPPAGSAPRSISLPAPEPIQAPAASTGPAVERVQPPAASAGPAAAPAQAPVRTEPPRPSGASSESEPAAGLPAAVATLIERVTGHRPDQASFTDAGLTSFDMLRTISALEKRVGALRKTLLFDHPTVPDLANFLLQEYGDSVVELVEAATADGVRADQPIRMGADQPATRAAAARPASGPIIANKWRLDAFPEVAATMAALDARFAKEGGLAGRDIAPLVFLGAERQGYLNFSRRGEVIFAWSYVGSAEYLPTLAEEYLAYAARHGLKPNFLSVIRLTEIGGRPLTATPFGAVQRLDDLSTFTLQGSKMQRLRNLIKRFQAAGECATEEYQVGSDPAVDEEIAQLMDRWGENKQMVNPYVATVQAEMRRGQLAERHRMFLTRVDGVLASAVIVTKIPSEPGYLLDLEFYPAEAPRGGLEYAIVAIIDKLRAEGISIFSFGASFGVRMCSSDNASPEVEAGMSELRSVGIFGEGNYQFKNKFRPTNLPIYLCQPDDEDRTGVSDVILMIADPDLAATAPEELSPGEEAPAADRTDPPTGSGGAPAAGTPAGGTPVGPGDKQGSGTPAAAKRPTAPRRTAGRSAEGNGDTPAAELTAAARAELLAAHGYSALQLPPGAVEFDFATDSWAEQAGPAVEGQLELLRARAGEASQADSGLDGITWLPFDCVIPTGSGRAAEALLARCWPAPPRVVLHNGVFPTWHLSLVDNGFQPIALDPGVSDGRFLDLDLDALTQQLASYDGAVSFVCIELANNAAGGVTVSLDNLRRAGALLAERGIPLVVDAARVVDAAALVVAHQTEGGKRALWDIVRELLECADAVTMSLTKDFGIDSGGLIATSDPALAERLREYVAAHGQQVSLSTRRLIAAALRDQTGIAQRVGTRTAAVTRLWNCLSDAGWPVPEQPGAHCVLVDVSQLPQFADVPEAVPSFLAWAYEHAGVRGAPHLVGGAQDHLVRLAVPVGTTVAAARTAGRRLAGLLQSAPPPLDLVATVAPDGSPAYLPAVSRVPEDIRVALKQGVRPGDDNLALLHEQGVPVQHHLLPTPDGTIEAFSAGTGPTLLLFHPFNIGVGLFTHQLLGLSDRFRVVVVHAPGVGSTEGTRDLTPAGVAGLYRQALRELDLPSRVHLAGASFGGLTAQQFALHWPDEVASLTLICSSYKSGNRNGEVNRLEVLINDDFDRLAAAGVPVDPDERARLQSILLRSESMDPKTGLRYLDVYATEPTLRDRLREIAVPTLVLQGRHDCVIAPDTTELLESEIPGAELAWLEGSGHFPSLTEPAEVNRLIADFASRHPVSDEAAG